MIKTSGDSIPFPLRVIFKSMKNDGLLHDDWKKSNVVQIHKKKSKDQIKIIDL